MNSVQEGENSDPIGNSKSTLKAKAVEISRKIAADKANQISQEVAKDAEDLNDESALSHSSRSTRRSSRGGNKDGGTHEKGPSSAKQSSNSSLSSRKDKNLNNKSGRSSSTSRRRYSDKGQEPEATSGDVVGLILEGQEKTRGKVSSRIV